MHKKRFSNYRGLWWLLATALVIFIVLSAFDVVSIGGHELKSSRIVPTMTAPPDGTAANTASASTPGNTAGVIATQSPQDQPAAIDTTSQTILFIGDSMLDGLYPRLAAYADKNGHTLYCVIWYSSTSEIWGNSDKLKKYIAQVNPTYIFICLGANELFVKDIAQKRDKYVKKMLADIGDIPYVWIGPPNWKEDTGINDLIASNAGTGHYFMSKDMKFPRMKDGAHPTHEAAIGWMDSVVRWMPAHSAHPIRLEVPDQKKSRAKRVFVHQPSER